MSTRLTLATGTSCAILRVPDEGVGRSEIRNRRAPRGKPFQGPGDPQQRLGRLGCRERGKNVFVVTGHRPGLTS